jgi:DNA-3-methyladenine glycosylase II
MGHAGAALKQSGLNAMGDAEKALAKLCPHMKKAVKRQPAFVITPEPKRDPYQALFRAIVYQQLSGKAAATILGRVVALFPGRGFVKPAAFLDVSEEALRGAGLSRQKIAALSDLSAKRLDGTVPPAAKIAHLPDDDIIARLTAVRGVGRWTVEMYLLFTLGRPDVWPVDDLAVRKGAELITGESFTPKTLAAYGDRWAPWRSAAAWHCWRAVDTKTPD